MCFNVLPVNQKTFSVCEQLLSSLSDSSLQTHSILISRNCSLDFTCMGKLRFLYVQDKNKIWWMIGKGAGKNKIKYIVCVIVAVIAICVISKLYNVMWPCYAGKIPTKQIETYTEKTLPNVTVVTAYFNLGTFRKGGDGSFNTGLYMKWSAVYQYIRNPFVCYTDSADVAKKFEKMREGYEKLTKIIIIKRQDVWSFDWVERIRKIYSTPGYPKHYPNTVVPEYSCVQHAKYAVVEDTINKKYFNTKYFTWIDLGYFRDIVNRKKAFVIVKPPHFNESSVAMNKVFDVNMDTSVETIFKESSIWIGGGMFFGTKDTLPTFIADYRQAVERYLNMWLSNTDQQVIFSMNTNKEKLVVRQRIPIQQYVADTPGDCWFYLGYACYRELP